ncbi:MAG TPA: YihY/virulence factor BrkB family protein [Acidimicrobiia bacterium]|nr:YihY/virulence factor BrkB family protein [Acidimicrobiia bacterium]
MASDPNIFVRVLEAIDRFQRTRPWLAFPVAVVKKFGDDQSSRLAALISYYGFFSLFPLLLILVTGLGFVLSGNEEIRGRVMDAILTQFPAIRGQIRASIGSLQGNGTGLAVGVAGLVWAGMGVMAALQDAMNTVWDVPIKRHPNFWKKRLRALLMLAVLGIGFLATSLLTMVGRIPALAGFGIGGLTVSLLFDVALFLLAFRVLTERKLGWAVLLPGAVVGAAGWVFLQWLGGFYVARVIENASHTYGFFAVVIGLLSWMYVLAQWVVLAAEVNVVRHEHLWPRTFLGDTLRKHDREALVRYAKVQERRPEQVVDVHFRPEGDAQQEAETTVRTESAAPGRGSPEGR